jgi:hypothetical protein
MKLKNSRISAFFWQIILQNIGKRNREMEQIWESIPA